VLLGDVSGFDVANRHVSFSGMQLPYDTLIVAAGARDNYFGHPEWEEFAPGLKSIEDATHIRARLFTAFERAERAADVEHRRILLTFVIVGGGPTGVELAGTMAEIARHTLRREFRHIDPADAQIILIEAGERILSAFPPELSAKAQASLEKLGVVVRTQTLVINVAADYVDLKFGGATERLPTHTITWAAGVSASPLASALAAATGASVDRGGRVVVNADLSLPGHPEILVLGDMASFTHQDGKALPGVAPVAIQQGKYAAKLVRARLVGKTLPAFRYRELGNLATIGRSAAVADFGKIRVSGFLAWFLWLVIHLMNLISFRNRLLVLIQWGWSYLTFDRPARLITSPDSELTDYRPPESVASSFREQS
jgi:NADH dehydrogenase